MRRLGFLVLLFLLLSAPALEARETPYKKGEQVRVEGLVVDDLGKPLPGVTVILAASRTRSDPKIRNLFFGEREDGVLEMLAKTDAHGRFRIGWSWDHFHDRFDLLAVAPQTRSNTERWVLVRRDVSALLNGDLPVIADLEVASSEDLRWLRTFLDGSASEEEQEVFTQMGRPDRIDFAKFDYDPDSSWWYFALGRVYRFRDGAIESIDSFEPVVP